jgi:hypothetical protein
MFANYNYTSIGGEEDGYGATMVFGAIFSILIVAVIGSSIFIYQNPDATNKSNFIGILVVSSILLVVMMVVTFLIKRYRLIETIA